MSTSPDRLFELLPSVHRRRDAEHGWPLRDLLRVVAEQVEVVEGGVERLYDNWFVETADEWAVAYLGELIGYRPVSQAGLTEAPSTPRHVARQAVLVPRRDVAATLGHSRRKGTLALLEELAADAAGWPARAVEMARLLRWAQALNHQRPGRGRLVDVRDVDALERLDGPFDELAHSVDVRRVNSHRTDGRHNLPEIALFVWRLGAYPVTRGPAYLAEQAGRNCFTFSVLGNDTPLFAAAVPEPDATHLAEESDVPAPIRRRALEERPPGSHPRAPAHASSTFYGEGRSIAVWAPGWPAAGAPQPVPAERVVPADLTGWRYRPQPGTVALDPVLGRLMFPARQAPQREVRVSYRYGFGADIGGGEYERPRRGPSPWALARITEADLVDPAGVLNRLRLAGDPLARYLLGRWSDGNRRRLDAWDGPPTGPPADLAAALVEELDLALADDGLFDGERFPGAPAALEAAALERPSGMRLALTNRRLLEHALAGALAVSSWVRQVHTTSQLRLALAAWRQDAPRRAVVELDATEVFSAPVDVTLAAGQELVLRAGPGTRPVLWLLDRDADRPDSLDVTLGPGAKAVLEGLLVTGRAVRMSGGAAIESEGAEEGGAEGEGPEVGEISPPEEGGAAASPAPVVDPGCPGTRQVVVRHCTLVPGWTLHHDCEPESPGEPSLELSDLGGACVTIEHSILGPVEVAADVEATDPVCLRITDSIVDATDHERLAIRGEGDTFAHAAVTIARATVFGTILSHSVDAAENSIFTGPVTSARRQHGCVRYSSLPAGSRTPRRFACQPDLVEEALRMAAGPGVDPAPEAVERERDRVRPRFTSTRYGEPAYGQLAPTCAAEIVRGADDESELGAFHDLYQPQRAANLAVRVDEHTAAGMDAGLVFVT